MSRIHITTRALQATSSHGHSGISTLTKFHAGSRFRQHACGRVLRLKKSTHGACMCHPHHKPIPLPPCAASTISSRESHPGSQQHQAVSVTVTKFRTDCWLHSLHAGQQTSTLLASNCRIDGGEDVAVEAKRRRAEAETVWSSISCVVDRICAAGGAVIPADPYQL
jgi:hypothetical protein